MKRLLLLLTLCSLSLVAAAQSVAKPQSIIFETDMGNDIDDAMALDLLFKNMDQGNINLLGVSVHKNNPHSAEYIDIMRHWYGYKKLPIGVNTACVTDMDCVDYCTVVSQLKDEKGKPLFRRSKNPKYEEAVDMYRRILAEQPDKSVVIVTVGFSTTMAQLLQSGPDKYSPLSGRELVERHLDHRHGTFYNLFTGTDDSSSLLATKHDRCNFRSIRQIVDTSFYDFHTCHSQTLVQLSFQLVIDFITTSTKSKFIYILIIIIVSILACYLTESRIALHTHEILESTHTACYRSNTRRVARHCL